MNAPVRVFDGISLEILSNALRSIADETFIALMKSAYSTNIKERRDHSTAIVDAKGRLVAQAEASLPIHIASMTGLMQHLLAKYGGRIRPGDIFVANDPHVAGGTHLPDINMAIPVFRETRLIGFLCNIAHHADVGGMYPGSMSGGMTEIFQEGLRLPVVRLFREGELQRDLFDLILLNVRIPEERRGDYMAQVASCRLGEKRLHELCDDMGDLHVEEGFGELIRRTEERFRKSLAAIPDGLYHFEDFLDDDGAGTFDISIQVTIHKSGDAIKFDFAGTSTQVRGNLNTTLNATQAAVCYALKALVDPDVPNNEGILAVPEILAPLGSVLNSVFPAPVAARAHTCQRVIDAVLGALAPGVPNLAVAAANGANTTAVFSGTDPRTGGPYVYLETLGGGFGGRSTKDGKDGVQVHITNTANLPVEAIEMEYPLFVKSYGFVPDSGGAGQHRGGSGIRRVISPVDHECTFAGTGERFRHRPWGLFGGLPGASGRFLLRKADGATVELSAKPPSVSIGPGEEIVIESPGAGGYGFPNNRAEADVNADVVSGKFTAAFATKHYSRERIPRTSW